MTRSVRLFLLMCSLAAGAGCSMCSDCADYAPPVVHSHGGYRPSYDSSEEALVTIDAEVDRSDYTPVGTTARKRSRASLSR